MWQMCSTAINDCVWNKNNNKWIPKTAWFIVVKKIICSAVRQNKRKKSRVKQVLLPSTLIGHHWTLTEKNVCGISIWQSTTSWFTTGKKLWRKDMIVNYTVKKIAGLLEDSRAKILILDLMYDTVVLDSHFMAVHA